MGPDKTVGDNKSDTTFSIVGIGASAGGLHSFECFLEALPKISILLSSSFNTFLLLIRVLCLKFFARSGVTMSS